MEKIVSVNVVSSYKLEILFADGFKGIIDVSPFIGGGISDALKSPEYFTQVSINEFSGITWPNGYDFCPNYLREIMKK